MSRLLEKLAGLTRKPARLVVGLVSGTSADAIHVALCRISGAGVPRAGVPGARVELLHYQEFDHDPDVLPRLRHPDDLGPRDLAELHVEIGAAFAEACVSGLQSAGYAPEDVDLVGSHGQTLYHHCGVPGTARCTLQLGDPDQIAERTGLPVIAEFRNRDVAAGGQGAPISPLADRILFATAPAEDAAAEGRVIVNLGGIATMTVLHDDPGEIDGFDTGPGNSLIDRLACILSNGSLHCDRDGQIAASGRVDLPLLERLLNDDSYLRKPPPKSTGFEQYGDVYLAEVAAAHGRYDADLMSTLTEFSARTIARALADFVAPGRAVTEVILAGGGVKNPVLRARIEAAVAPLAVRRSDDLGVPAEAREAMVFAVLANETLHGHPATLPRVTGARHPVPLGRLALPRL